MVQISGENSKPFCSMRSGRVTKIYPSLTFFLSKDEEIKNIGHSMSIRNLIFCVNSVTVSYLIRYDSLLQNGRDVIRHCDSYFITKCIRFFVTKCDSFITKCNSYYKVRRFYHKIRHLLQNAKFITNCDSTKRKFLPNKHTVFDVAKIEYLLVIYYI